jgi:D-amino-acid dehydrogenase
MTDDVLIVGGGIIGTYCAIQIARTQKDLTIRILDRDPHSYDGASCGNMGGFVTCEVQPLATLRNLLRSPLMMLNPLAPLTIRLRNLSSFSDWAFGFVRAALTPGHYQRVVNAQSTLMERAHQAHLDVIGGSDLTGLLSDEGTICLYRRQRTLEHDWRTRWKLFRERGEVCHKLDLEALRIRFPDLDPQIRHAVHVPSVRYWREPACLLEGLHQMARSMGVTIEQGEARQIEFENDKPVSLCRNDGKSTPFHRLSVAAGAWSGYLCGQLGDRIPVNTERGYSTTINTRSAIKNLILFPDDDFVATPMNSGLRLGGTLELAGLEAPPNYRRTALLAKQLRSYFPSISTQPRTDWMGHRPSLPDTLPVIGQSPSHDNVVYAFGHGHVGMTQSAITGKLVSQIVAGQDADIDLAPFMPSRFSA